jgi:hypothetical protein
MKSLATIKPRFRGPDGKKLQLNTSATHLQWRLEGDQNWIDLAALDNLATLAMPKTGGAFTGNVQVRNILETVVIPSGTISGTVTLDFSLGNVFNLLLDGDIAKFNLINIPQAYSGDVALSFTMILKQKDTAIRSVNFAFDVNNASKPILWPGGFEPIVSSIYSATDVVSFMTLNAGATWFGFVGGQGY